MDNIEVSHPALFCCLWRP